MVWLCVVTRAVPDISKVSIAFTFKCPAVQERILPRLLDVWSAYSIAWPLDAGNHSASRREPHCRRPEFSQTTLWELQIRQSEKQFWGEKRLLVSSCLSVCPSARMEQLSSHWLHFTEIWYLIIFRIILENIQVSFKSDKKNEYFEWRQIYTFDHISFSSS